jgi:hypothetical protein
MTPRLAELCFAESTTHTALPPPVIRGALRSMSAIAMAIAATISIANRPLSACKLRALRRLFVAESVHVAACFIARES